MEIRYELDDEKKLAVMRPADWQLDLLRANPEYIGWETGNGVQEKDAGKKTSKPFVISDDERYIAGFYFSLCKDSEPCTDCGESGLSRPTKLLADTFYGRGRWDNGWGCSLTQDEADLLWEKGRLTEMTRFRDGNGNWQRRSPDWRPTLDEVNAHFRTSRMGHDGINRQYLLEQRAKRLGHEMHCSSCGGTGHKVIGKTTYVTLNLWLGKPGSPETVHRSIVKIGKKNAIQALEILLSLAEEQRNRLNELKKFIQQNQQSKNATDVLKTRMETKIAEFMTEDDSEYGSDFNDGCSMPTLNHYNELVHASFGHDPEKPELLVMKVLPRGDATILERFYNLSTRDFPKIDAFLNNALERLDTRFAGVSRLHELLKLSEKAGLNGKTKKAHSKSI